MYVFIVLSVLCQICLLIIKGALYKKICKEGNRKMNISIEQLIAYEEQKKKEQEQARQSQMPTHLELDHEQYDQYPEEQTKEEQVTSMIIIDM